MGEMADWTLECGEREDWQASLNEEKWEKKSPLELVETIEAIQLVGELKFEPNSAPVGIAKFFRERGYITKPQRDLLVRALARRELIMSPW